MASKWDRDAKKEELKLSPKESDWQLAGMGSTSGRRIAKKNRFFDEGNSSSDSTFADVLCSGSEEEEDDDDDEWNDAKPPASRLMLEEAPLRELVENNAGCPICGGELELQFKTMTITATASLNCKSKECLFMSNSRSPAEANLLQFGDDNRDRSTDFALNCQCVLSVICNGDRPTEAGRLLGLLGSPNDTTMDSRSFDITEERMAPVIWNLCEEIMLTNLKEELKATITDAECALREQSLNTDADFELSIDSYPKICGSFDTGWNQRASGKQCNSPSSHHSFIVGQHTRKAVCGETKSRLCSHCIAWKKRVGNEGIDVPDHWCLQNCEGTSGGMEAQACVDLVVRIHTKCQVNIQFICMDDDASARTH